MIPALRINTSILSLQISFTFTAASRTLSKLIKSQSTPKTLTSDSELAAAARTSRNAFSARSLDLLSITMHSAPFSAHVIAISYPSPVVEPVNTTTLPAIGLGLLVEGASDPSASRAEIPRDSLVSRTQRSGTVGFLYLSTMGRLSRRNKGYENIVGV